MATACGEGHVPAEPAGLGVERRYCHIKQWRGLAARYDKHVIIALP